MAVVAAVLSAAALAGAPCPSAPDYPAPAPDRPRYALTIRIPRPHDVVTGTLRLSFTPNRATPRLYLRLWPNGPYTRSRGARLTVSGVRVDGARVRTTTPDPTTLVLSRAARAEERVRVALSWRLLMPRRPAGRLSTRGDTLRLASFFPLVPWDPSRGWVLDRPTRTIAEAWTSPTADFDVHVSARRGDVVLASGERVGPGHWRAHALRDFALAAGRFRVAHAAVSAPNPVRVAVGVERGAGTPSGAAFLARVRRALRELSRRYGPYPWPTFTLAVTGDIGASGIEYPTLVFQGGASLYRATTHETAHQWFYSLVGNDQAQDPWLDEALATWAAGRIDGNLSFFAHFPVPGAVRGRVGAPMRFWDAHPSGYFAGVYAQGVRALDSLGDEEGVDCALRLYVAHNAYGIARPLDLVSALQRVFPNADADLQRFGVQPR